jgi:hypothetical protein
LTLSLERKMYNNPANCNIHTQTRLWEKSVSFKHLKVNILPLKYSVDCNTAHMYSETCYHSLYTLTQWTINFSIRTQ